MDGHTDGRTDRQTLLCEDASKNGCETNYMKTLDEVGYGRDNFVIFPMAGQLSLCFLVLPRQNLAVGQMIYFNNQHYLGGGR